MFFFCLSPCTWISSRRSFLYVLMLSISIFSSAVKSEETAQKRRTTTSCRFSGYLIEPTRLPSHQVIPLKWWCNLHCYVICGKRRSLCHRSSLDFFLFSHTFIHIVNQSEDVLKSCKSLISGWSHLSVISQTHLLYNNLNTFTYSINALCIYRLNHSTRKRCFSRKHVTQVVWFFMWNIFVNAK